MLKNIPLLVITGIAVPSVSLYADWGQESYFWFQRSGSFMVLVGALLGYRSIMRLGVKGVGGQSDTGAWIGKIERVYEQNGRRQDRPIRRCTRRLRRR